MKKQKLYSVSFCLIFLCNIALAQSNSDDESMLHVFQSQEIIEASKMNENFDYVLKKIESPSVILPLVKVSDELSGNNCNDGGYKIEVGLDYDENKELENNEVTSYDFICTVKENNSISIMSDVEYITFADIPYTINTGLGKRVNKFELIMSAKGKYSNAKWVVTSSDGTKGTLLMTYLDDKDKPKDRMIKNTSEVGRIVTGSSDAQDYEIELLENGTVIIKKGNVFGSPDLNTGLLNLAWIAQ